MMINLPEKEKPAKKPLFVYLQYIAEFLLILALLMGTIQTLRLLTRTSTLDPFETEVMFSAIRVLDGGAAPSANYLPLPVSPGFIHAAAGFMAIFGKTLVAVSSFAFLGYIFCAVTLALLVKNKTNQTWLALLAALMLLLYRFYAGNNYLVIRNFFPYWAMGFMILGIYIFERRQNVAAHILAILCFTAAFLFDQDLIIFVLLYSLYRALNKSTRNFWLLGATVGFLCIVILLLQWRTSGWAGWYYGYLRSLKQTFFEAGAIKWLLMDFLTRYALVLLFPLAGMLWMFSQRHKNALFWLVFTGGSLMLIGFQLLFPLFSDRTASPYFLDMYFGFGILFLANMFFENYDDQRNPSDGVGSFIILSVLVIMVSSNTILNVSTPLFSRIYEPVKKDQSNAIKNLTGNIFTTIYSDEWVELENLQINSGYINLFLAVNGKEEKSTGIVKEITNAIDDGYYDYIIVTHPAFDFLNAATDISLTYEKVENQNGSFQDGFFVLQYNPNLEP